MSRISTPCVSYCWIDPNHGLCEGCGRTKDEIASWCFITEDERLSLMPGLKARLAALGLPTAAAKGINTTKASGTDGP
jgi:predicted Fe-S protein YdhL (DUF1289 family)